jgi:hypothetical protein
MMLFLFGCCCNCCNYPPKNYNNFCFDYNLVVWSATLPRPVFVAQHHLQNSTFTFISFWNSVATNSVAVLLSAHPKRVQQTAQNANCNSLFKPEQMDRVSPSHGTPTLYIAKVCKLIWLMVDIIHYENLQNTLLPPSLTLHLMMMIDSIQLFHFCIAEKQKHQALRFGIHFVIKKMAHHLRESVA